MARPCAVRAECNALISLSRILLETLSLEELDAHHENKEIEMQTVFLQVSLCIVINKCIMY